MKSEMECSIVEDLLTSFLEELTGIEPESPYRACLASAVG